MHIAQYKQHLYENFTFKFINETNKNMVSSKTDHSDPCHLAWIIRDNRNLLPAVYLGQCSNGTTFEDLDPNGYNDCPILETDTKPSSVNFI